MKILLAADSLNAAGGIAISVEALKKLLLKLGHDVCVGIPEDSSFKPDLIWTHGWSSDHSQQQIRMILALSQAKLWSQIHDYKDFCLTSRKAIGKEMLECDRAFGGSCFQVHYTRNCGRARNPLKLIYRYGLIRDRLKLIQKADRVIVFSDSVKRVCLKNGISEGAIYKSRPWIDLSNDSHMPWRDRPQESPRILWVGRLVKEKGTDLLLKCIQKWSSQAGGGLSLSIVGDGPEKENLRLSLERLGVQFEIFPWMDRSNLYSHYLNSNLLLMTSIWPEPYGFVGVEALSLGLPVVALNRGGISEWCKPEAGCLLFDDLLADNVFERIRPYLNDFQFRQEKGKSAVEFYRRQLSESCQLEDLKRILEKADR